MQNRTSLMVSGIGLRSQVQEILYNQGLIGSSSHQERGLQGAEKVSLSPQAPSSENPKSRPPDPLPSGLGVQAPDPHLALMLTNVQMSVHLEHLSCSIRRPAQPSSSKQVQEPESR